MMVLNGIVTIEEHRKRSMQLVVKQKHFGPRSFFLAVLTINLMVIMCIDMYVPALPSMQQEFHVSESYLNLTMFVFFFFSAFSMMLTGPLSDRFGRCPVLRIGCILYVISTLLCVIAPSIEVLVFDRIIQSLGYGALITLGTALIKDSYQGQQLQMAMTVLQSSIIIGPALAPFIGTLILSLSDWRGIFVFLTACSVVALVLALLMSETHHPAQRLTPPAPTTTDESTSVYGMWTGIKALLSQRPFTSLMLLMGVAGIPYFAFIAVVSYILMDFFAVDYFQYSLIYATACLVTIAAPYCYMWLAKHFRAPAILRIIILCTLISTVLLFGIGSWMPWLFLVAFIPYALAEGIVRPMAFVILLDQPKNRVGVASSLANFSYTILTSFATVFATLPWPNFIWGLGIITAGSALLMMVCYLWGKQRN